jgi:hypothetical protein
MAVYRCYFLDRVGEAAGAQDLDCGSDADAVTAARRIHEEEFGSGFELFQGNRRVHVEPAKPG